MESKKIRCRSALAALVLVWQAGVAIGQFETPSCPTVEDQLVNVTAQVATEFTLTVENLGRGSVTIFQYPLGGALMTGMKKTEWVFIPDEGFTGTSTFMYRVTPEKSCTKGAILGKVTFVGPTTGRQFTKTTETTACGASLPLMLVTCGFMIGAARRRRWAIGRA